MLIWKIKKLYTHEVSKGVRHLGKNSGIEFKEYVRVSQFWKNKKQKSWCRPTGEPAM